MKKLTKYLDDESVNHIIQFKQQGKGSRWIADFFGVSKSFVNQLYKRWQIQSTVAELEKQANIAQYGTQYNPNDVAFKHTNLLLDKAHNELDKAGQLLGEVLDKVIEITGKKQVAQMMTERWKRKQPRVLLLDIETTADIVATFGRFKVNIGESNIIQQGNQIATAAWRFKDSSDVYQSYSEFNNYHIDGHSEKELLTDLVEAISESDIVVIHNARFDLGTIQHRMLHYGMGRLPSVKVIDTLMISRKYLKLRSNKLDSITKYFGLSNKLENSGIDLWIKVQQGDVEAREQMLEYNVGDVIALEDVYNKFVALNQGVNLSVYTQLDQKACTSCGSHNVNPTGRQVTTGVSMFDEYECGDCGAKMRGRTNKLTKEQRQNILMPV